MIRISQRPANADDLKALSPLGALFGQNVVKGSLPLAALVFVGAFVVTRSILLAAVLGGRLAELVMK